MKKRTTILLLLIILAGFLPFIPLFINVRIVETVLIGSIASSVIFFTIVHLTRTRKGDDEIARRKEVSLYASVYASTAIISYVIGLIKLG